MLDLRQTSPYAKFAQSIGWTVEKHGAVCVFIKKIPIVGKVIKIQRPQTLNKKLLDLIIKKHKPFQIIIEPKNQKQSKLLIEEKYRVNSPYLPSKTIYIDLKNSKKEILKRMHHKTRYNIISGLKKKNLQIVRSKDIATFSDFWHDHQNTKVKVLRVDDQIINLYKNFGNNADLLMAYKNKKLVAGILLVSTKSTMYYMYARASKLGKKTYAPTLLVWEALLLGKKRGLKYFDFEGIFDSRFPINSWKGFSRFKSSFGGKEIAHPGAYSKILPYLNIKINPKSQNLLAIGFIILGIFAFWVSITHTQELTDFASKNPLIAPLLIILWRTIGVVIPPIPGGLLALAMIPVFGWFLAFLYGAVGLIIGCSLAFWLARRYGTKFVANFIPISQIHKLEKKMSEQDRFFAFLMVRFATGPVMDFASYVAGLSKVKFSTFILATIISILPDALYYYLGEALYRQFSPVLIFLVILTVASVYITQKILFKRKGGEITVK
jgi:uncharacterized membrane protein YdjX (TVP38/TMEM64 family)